MGRKADHDTLLRELGTPSAAFQPLYVLCGDEPLLQVEAADAVRTRARQDGFTERSSFTFDARADWSPLFAAAQNISLFGDRKLVDLSIPSGKPGKPGADALQRLCQLIASGQMDGTAILIQLPRLDKATRNTKWCQALEQAACWVDIQAVGRAALPGWIAQRLRRQEQSLERDSLEWMADKVEGNLLAAFQEIQKLALIYPPGALSQQELENAVLNVARYSVFDLRDAMLSGQSQRALTILDGLQAEGEALPLVLWAVGDEVRTLARLARARQQGQDIAMLFRQNRIFGPREKLVRQTLDRIPDNAWPAAVLHAHDIDRLIKGLRPAGRQNDPWEEMRRLTLRIAVATRAARA
ncbi:MAG TPA: DNA polymerase III subunit delta [Alcaligenes sp.]|nr:DNA polymerase III subunit delta [Alcaligenes sp.]HRL28490.1 DNA polymerase III subunit delta [Alcaligenes sp.]